MGRSFWLRVGGGALAIFVLGFALYAGARQAKRSAAQALTEISSELGGQVPAMLASLRDSVHVALDGRPLGSLRRISVHRADPNGLPELVALVALDSPGFERRLAECDLTPEQGKDLHRLRCVTAGEPGLQKVGVVRFDRGRLTRTLWVTDSMAAELSQGEPFNVEVDLTDDVQATVHAGGNKILQLKADSSGAHLVVNDREGRKVVRMHADSTGFSLTVDSARAR